MNSPSSEQSGSSAPTRREAAALAAVFLAALLLRLYHLGAYAFWQDEVHNFDKAEHLWEVITTGNFVSNHPPLTPALLRLWIELGLAGSEFSARLLFLLLGLAGIASAYLLARRLFGPRTAIITAFLMAIAPFHVHHSQEIKEYILLPFTGVLMVLSLYQAMERNTFRTWTLYALLAAISCYSELFAGPLLVAVNLWALTQMPARPGRFKAWFFANTVGALLFLPQLGVMLKAARAIMVDSTTWWLPPPNLYSVVFYLKTLAFGYSDTQPLFKIALACYLLAAFAGAFLALRHAPRRALLLLAWFILPIAMVYGISHVTQSIFLLRALSPFAPPFYILAAHGIARIPKAPLRGTLSRLCRGLGRRPPGRAIPRPLPPPGIPPTGPASIPRNPTTAPPNSSSNTGKKATKSFIPDSTPLTFLSASTGSASIPTPRRGAPSARPLSTTSTPATLSPTAMKNSKASGPASSSP